MNIRYLPKDELLFRLWAYAKYAKYFTLCSELAPCLTIDIARRDITEMRRNNWEIDLTTYYGRLLFVNLSKDHFDAFTYNMYNGEGLAEQIINELKHEELQKIRTTVLVNY